MEEYLPGGKACKILGVHPRTLYLWDEKKTIETIRTPGGKRLYNVKKYLENIEKNKPKEIKKEEIKEIIKDDTIIRKKIIYARVSTSGQKNDLDRQVEVLKEKYPNYELIKDIGSGMNMNRRGLRKIIDMAIKGEIEEVVVVHKDRLARFGYELVKDLIDKYSKGKIIIMERREDKEAKEELVEDVLQIMNIFVAKMNGMRKYKKREMIKENNKSDTENESLSETESDSESEKKQIKKKKILLKK
jgi:putative resolvase